MRCVWQWLSCLTEVASCPAASPCPERAEMRQKVKNENRNNAENISVEGRNLIRLLSSQTVIAISTPGLMDLNIQLDFWMVLLVNIQLDVIITNVHTEIPYSSCCERVHFKYQPSTSATFMPSTHIHPHTHTHTDMWQGQMQLTLLSIYDCWAASFQELVPCFPLITYLSHGYLTYKCLLYWDWSRSWQEFTFIS